MLLEDVRDRDSLQAWFENLPQAAAAQQLRARSIRCQLASRSALRLIPIWWGDILSHKRDVTPTPFLRCFLISAVTAKYPTAGIRAISIISATKVVNADAAAFITHTASYTDVYTASNDAAVAASAAYLIDDGDYWALLQSELAALAQGDDLFSTSLWPADMPESIPISPVFGSSAAGAWAIFNSTSQSSQVPSYMA